MYVYRHTVSYMLHICIYTYMYTYVHTYIEVYVCATRTLLMSASCFMHWEACIWLWACQLCTCMDDSDYRYMQSFSTQLLMVCIRFCSRTLASLRFRRTQIVSIVRAFCMFAYMHTYMQQVMWLWFVCVALLRECLLCTCARTPSMPLGALVWRGASSGEELTYAFRCLAAPGPRNPETPISLN